MAKNVQEAERAVIAVLLTDEEYMEQILNECRAEMFADAGCRQIFLIAEKLSAAGTPVDLTTVHTQCEREFTPELISISQTYNVPSNIDSYILTVKEAWQFRKAGQKLRECLEKAQGHDPECYEAIATLQDDLFEGSAEEQPVAGFCEKALETIGKKQTGLTTGFKSLDLLLGGGLLPGRLMVMGARPGMGKSALALEMAVTAARNGAAVLYITLEMTALELTQRALCMLAGVCPAKAEEKEAMEKLNAAGREMNGLRLYMRDAGDSSLAAVLGACRRVRAREGRLDLVVIDYVGLMRTERTKTSTRQQEIAEISRGLKRYAIKAQTCILLLSQLNRESDARDDHIPRLSDLRESGDLEQDADIVLFPLRPVLYGEEDIAAEDAFLYIAKNRSGSPGRVEMTWHGPTCTFTERETGKAKKTGERR